MLHFSPRRDDNIMLAAGSGDLAAVRGHLRRDRRCLDRLFSEFMGVAPGRAGGSTVRRTEAAFLLAKGAASGAAAPGAQKPPGVAAGGRRRC